MKHKILMFGVILGVILHSFLTCLFQDYVGLDAYIELCTKRWITLPWQIWIVPIGINLLMIGTMYHYYKGRN
jgi:hypothetical protein